MDLLGQILAVVGLVFGFGFVVFFHELGHFLAAKWVGIRVEQFAIGFGHAVASWRKGIGLRMGSTRAEYERRVQRRLDEKRVDAATGPVSEAQMNAAAAELGLGETEYRFNWMPLGGYVKMLGQDDMNPNAQVDDPRAYNRKSIAARMFVVSAGVIMNVILAAVLFSMLFIAGFRVPPAIIGSIQTNSPAQEAGLQVGDKIVYFDGHYQHDFSKLFLWAALVKPNEPVSLIVERDGKQLPPMTIQPERATKDTSGFLALGVGPIAELRGIDQKLARKVAKQDWDPKTEILPGDTVIAINGAAVGPTDYAAFDRAVQASKGQPVAMLVRGADGKERTVHAPVLLHMPGAMPGFFGEVPFNMAGLMPRPVVDSIAPESPVHGKLLKGDVITAIQINGRAALNPAYDELIRLIHRAGDEGTQVALVVERDGKQMTLPAVVPTVSLGQRKKGLGIGLGLQAERPVVSSVLKDSAAAKAGVPNGSLLLTVNGQEVKNWFDVREQLKKSTEPTALTYQELDENGKAKDAQPQKAVLTLSSAERQTLENIRYAHDLILRERIVKRQTSNPLRAASWGVEETRDLLLQFYVTLHRLTMGSVSAKNFMGPLGIVHTGSLIAFKGWDWLVWFLAMISANLAVVNFLPIPIVDGGLFVFLIIEKIVGRPLSPRMQTVAQLVGLAIILSVFVFVTYQDIHRLF